MTPSRQLVIASLVSLICTAASARDLELGTPFRDHMVLQRGKPIPVWGWAEPGDEVTVAFAEQRRVAMAAMDGAWTVRLEPLSASKTPASLTVTSRGGGTITVTDVLVGEVWLGSGQSNMRMQVARADDYEREKSDADLPLVRMFTEESPGASTPQDRGLGTWSVCTPGSVGAFSATLFFFGREIHRALDVPVGLIHSSVGGTPIEAWIGADAQRRSPELAAAVAAIDADGEALSSPTAVANHGTAMEQWRENAAAARRAGRAPPRRPKDPIDSLNRRRLGCLFNGKIAPLVPFAIRGVVWYQGEANAQNGRAEHYRHQLPLLVSDWRERWGEELPFAWVQLPNFGRGGEGWMVVREAMLEGLRLPRTGMAITVDIGDPKDIHPRNKQDVGRRLAAWALADVYEQDVPARSGPLPAGSEVRGSDVVCRFSEDRGLC
ncbi:MAG: sialate O-acetylesterase, partial [Planctomycetaceae bacterium]